jgi:hypothetical protein
MELENINERKDMNPAARLLEFVNKALSVPGNLPAMQGWRKVLDLEEENYIEIYTGIADIIQLTVDARKAIIGLNGYDQPLLLGQINKVLSAIDVANLQGTWEIVTRQFDALTVQGLRFCSTVLDQHWREASLSDDQIKSWLEEIENLRNSVTTSEVPDQLKIFFFEHLEKLRYALLHYWIFGWEGVQSAVERTIGAIAVRIPQNPAIKKNSFWDKFLALLTNLANAITVLEGAQSLSGDVLSLLSGAP